MINYGGKKIFPLETERLIRKNKLVEYVKIIEMPNSLFGQSADAEIRLKNDSDENRQALKQWLGKNITNYKIPRKIMVNGKMLV